MTTATPTEQYARTVDRAFELFQPIVNTDPDELKEARRRRDLFDVAFEAQPDTLDVFCSGSLARKTHKDPIHDVDSVVVFKHDTRPDWGRPGPNAGAALDELAADVEQLLGVDGGTVAREVTAADPGNHAVRCAFGQLRGHDFTVDVMPALLVTGGLLVPVAEEDRWELVEPQFFITETARRQARYDDYVPLVRVLKFWKDERKNANPLLDAKSLLIEVLAFELLTTATPRPEALERFFTAAALRVRRDPPVSDPAGLCGPIQPDVNLPALTSELDRAADLARRANLADNSGAADSAISLWGMVFGPSFPRPRPQVSVSASGGHGAIGAAAAAAVPVQQSGSHSAQRRLRDEPGG